MQPLAHKADYYIIRPEMNTKSVNKPVEDSSRGKKKKKGKKTEKKEKEQQQRY